MLFVKFRSERGSLHGSADFRSRFEEFRIPQFLEGQHFVLGAQRFIFPDNGALFDEINYADEIVFSADGILKGNGVGRKSLPHRAARMVETGAARVPL